MKKEVYLVLHNIRSAHNVGSIFRTADAAGVAKIFLCGYTPTPTRFARFDLGSAKRSNLGLGSNLQESKIAKTALGAEKTVPWEQHKQTWRLLKKLSTRKVGPCVVVALEQDKKAIDYRKFKPEFPMALILGNEVEGLSKEILKYTDKIIAIPMYGQKESLNVSVAAGVALFKLTESAV